MTGLYYKVKVRNEMSLFLGENQYFYKKIIHFFAIEQVKFLKFIVFIYLVLNLMLHYSTYIYPVVFTYKTCQIFSFLASKTDIFIFRYILRNACFAIS